MVWLIGSIDWHFRTSAIFPENALFMPWEPTKEEIQLLKENPKRRKLTGNATIGWLSTFDLNMIGF